MLPNSTNPTERRILGHPALARDHPIAGGKSPSHT